MLGQLMSRARSKRRLSAALVSLALVVTVSACALPGAPPYPYWGPYLTRQGVINEVQLRSNNLEGFVKRYLDGTGPAAVPRNLLPDGLDKDLTNAAWTVQKESEIDPAKQWVVRPRENAVSWQAAHGEYPDIHATYLFMPEFLPPFGSKAIVTGSFPHSRFFDIQATPSFQPEQYNYDLAFGVGENPIVDADINPNLGSTNPFRVGANRQAANRNYTVTLESKIANAAQTDPSFKPGYRGPGNTRSTTGFVYQGPWGDPFYPESNNFIKHNGYFAAAQLWVRYYAPDKNVDALGGVALPKVTYQLPDGRKYFLSADLTASRATHSATAAIPATTSTGPTAADGSVGFTKMWGIMRSGLQGIGQTLYGPGWADKDYVRRTDKGANGRGEDLPAPQNYEASKTLCAYCHYLERNMTIGDGKVVTFTGRLPTTPKTRNGEQTMTGGQLRYWSLTAYDQTFTDGGPFGRAAATVMDDEVVTDANGWFTIVLSRAKDRPSNATAANGVTWIDWGPQANVMFMVRYLVVGPEWTFAQAPSEVNLGRASDWASTQYNVNLLGKNNRNGFMADYQPVIAYMTPTDFQNLGNHRIDPKLVPPLWRS